jgi:ATP-dependent DNA helicase RecG
MLQIVNELRSKITPDIMVCSNIAVDNLGDKQVIHITVTPGGATPYYLKSKGPVPDGVYVRRGLSSVHASREAITQLLLRGLNYSWEDAECPFQELTFEQSRSVFRRHNLSLEQNNMMTLGFYNDRQKYTNLAYAFSDQFAYSVKIARFTGNNKMEFLDRRELSGSLLQLADSVYDYVSMFNSLPAKIVEKYRVEQHDYPDVAIRELIYNMLIHRNYIIQASSFINIYDDRMEFLSLGGLVSGVTKQSLYDGVSVPRNAKIANIFYRLNLIEAYGTGLLRIIESYNQKSAKPLILPTESEFRVILPNENYGLGIKENLPEGLTQEQQKIYATIAKKSHENEILENSGGFCGLSKEELQNLTGQTKDSVRRSLEKLIRLELVKKVGAGRATRYATIAKKG